MALQITKTEQGFLLTGRLHTNQLFEIRNFFKSKLSTSKELSISLAGLDDLDLSAALFFKELKDLAKRTHKKVHISSDNNQKILGPFRKLEDPYVLAA